MPRLASARVGRVVLAREHLPCRVRLLAVERVGERRLVRLVVRRERPVGKALRDEQPRAPVRLDEWGLDVVVVGSQKALMLPPGLAIVAASDKGWKANERANLPRFYLDLARERNRGAPSDWRSWEDWSSRNC